MDLYNKNTRKTMTQEQVPMMHQLYNLLFAGKISMQDYFQALQKVKDASREA